MALDCGRDAICEGFVWCLDSSSRESGVGDRLTRSQARQWSAETTKVWSREQPRLKLDLTMIMKLRV